MITDVPYEPALRHICSAPTAFEAHKNCRVVECKHCHNDWPCPGYQSEHSFAETAEQARWAQRVREV